MTGFALLFTLAAIGLAETSYLIRKRKSGQHAACIIGRGCSDVLEGKYNTTLGIHNDVLGFVFYACMMLVTGLYVVDMTSIEYFSLVVNTMLLGAAIMTLRFLYLQWRVIKVWCFWCLMSSATIGLMILIVTVGSNG